MQASLNMLAMSTAAPEPAVQNEYGREPFKHPALAGLAGLTLQRKNAILDKKRTARLAEKYGLTEVLRWKPRKVGSCIKIRTQETLY